MTVGILHLEFGANGIKIPDDADISLKKEDYEKAREIGVLTPRKNDFYKIPDTDYEPYKNKSESKWITLVKDYANSDKNVKNKYQELIDDIEFIQLQEHMEGEGDPDHVDMLDDLGDLWEKDLDGTVFDINEPFGYKACRAELLPQTSTQIVRITIKKNGFYIGSIAGQPANVYIPKNISKKELNVHSYYFMHLKFAPSGRNMWAAVVVGDKMPSSSMKIGTTNQTVSYRIPTPGYLIGAMIGKEGRNINNLCQSVKDWYKFTGEVPEFTITPDGDTHTMVNVRLPNDCNEWGYNEIEYVVDHMHY
jgi:hypothetical protein